MKLPLTSTLLMIFSFLTGSTSGIDERYYYRLTNSYLGEAYSLDTASNDPNLPIMAKSGNSSGQYWKLMAHDDCYRLTNVMLGPDRSLDTYPSGGNFPFMGPSGNFSGQCWHLTSIGNGYVRVTNDYLGNSHSLDTYSSPGHEPFMAESNTATGQLWKLTRLTRQ